MRRTVQIVLPGLFDLPLHELEPKLLRQELPQLNRILRRATAKSNQAYTIDAILASALALHDSLQAVPAGLAMAQAFADDAAAKTERMLLCQAIHLRPDMHSAVIVPIPADEDNLQDINILINDLSELFKVDYNIIAVADKLLNEIQMFMHQHPVNQQRIQRGTLPINSLWFWGGGRRCRPPDSNLAWFCDDPLLNRFARSLGLAPRPCSEIDTIAKPGDALVIDLRLLELLKTERQAPLEQLLLDIDHTLLEPLLAMAHKGRTQIVLRAGYEFDFVLKPSALMKFWRTQKNLSDWATVGDGS